MSGHNGSWIKKVGTAQTYREHNDFFCSPELETSVLEAKCKLRAVVLSSTSVFKSVRLGGRTKVCNLWCKVGVLTEKE